jgi:hypothetical protein
LTQLKSDLSALAGRVTTLEGSVLKNTQDIAQLRSDLTSLEGRVARNEGDIAQLKLDLALLTTQVGELEEELEKIKKMGVGVIVQGTSDPVFGRLNTLLIDQKTLCGFVGKNASKIDEFPYADDDYNAKHQAETLKANEIDEDWIVEFKGAKQEWLMDTNTFGKVYVTVNPLGVDASQCDFTLVRTDKVEAAVKLGGAAPSATILTQQLGKRIQRTGELDPTDDAPLMWELQATADSADFKDFLFDWTTFSSDYVPRWTMANLNATIKQIWNVLNDGTKSKTERAGYALEQAQGILKLIYDAIQEKRSQLANYAVLCTYEGRTLASEADIISVAIEPLGYNVAVNFDEANKSFDLSTYKYIARKIYGKLAEKLPTMPSSITLGPADESGKFKVYVDAVTAAALGQAYIEVNVTDFKNGLNLQEIEDMVNDALKFYTRVKNADAGNLVTRAETKLNSFLTKVLNKYNNQIATISVQPLLTYPTEEEGMVKLNEVNNNIAGDDLDLVFTSLTGEYIIPVFQKYIAVIQDGKIVYAKRETGDTQLFNVPIPEGKSEIVVQALDYTGYAITKRYPINRTK